MPRAIKDHICMYLNSAGRSVRCAVSMRQLYRGCPNSLFTKRTGYLTCGLDVSQCHQWIIRITSNPFIVAAAVFIV